MKAPAEEIAELASFFGVSLHGELEVRSPIDGFPAGSVGLTTRADAEASIAMARDAFLSWRLVPAPRRGELVRILGLLLREYKEPLGRLVTLECGKPLSEGLGEVQEMIDICDFAVGLSRQLYGLTIASERPGHRMMESWQPLGVIGIISAFNFPVAVWSWNAALALVCGNSIIWKPSEKTPLVALAVQSIVEKAIEQFGKDAPKGLSATLVGGPDLGELLADRPDIALLSATGSTRMGRCRTRCSSIWPIPSRAWWQQCLDHSAFCRSGSGPARLCLWLHGYSGAALHIPSAPYRP